MTTAAVDGADTCANVGSEFSRGTGDEPRTGGGVASHVNTCEATWLTYSFDVSLEGKGACRLTDKMFHNRRNAVNMAGLVQPPLKPPSDPKCIDLYEIMYRLVWAVRDVAGQGTQGLAWRWKKMAENPGGWTPADNETHIKTYEEQRRGLRRQLKRWRRNGCKDDDLPPGTPEYASDQSPELGPGKPITPTPQTSEFRQFLKHAGIAVAGAAAGAATAFVVFEVVTRIIRAAVPVLWPLEALPI